MVENRSGEFGEFIQEQHSTVGKTEFSWSGIGASSKQCCSCCAVMWASKGALPDQLAFPTHASSNRMEAGDFEGFLPVQWRKQ